MQKDKRYIDTDIIDKLIEEYLKGSSQLQLERKYGVTRPTILKFLKRRGYKVRQTFQRKVNFNPFKNLADPEVQYWLGWIITDGNVYKNRVSLNSTGKDIDVLENYCKFLKIDKSHIYRKILPNPNHDDKCVVRFTNNEVAKYLFDLGITPNKSLTVDPKIEFSDDLVRGMLEGDGSFSLYENKRNGKKSANIHFISASKALSDKYRSYLNSNNIDYYSGTQKTYFITRVGAKNTINLIKLIYGTNCIIYSKRKYNISQKILNHYNEL